jgi:hypothetical protein
VSLAAHPSGGLVTRVTPVYLFALVPQVLIVAGLLVALIVAAAKRNQLGTKAFSLMATGLALLILAECGGAFFNAFAYRVLAEASPNIRIGTFVGISSLITRAIWITGLGLVIGAVFADRPHRTAVPADAPRP